MKKLPVLLLLAAAPIISFAQKRSPIRFGLKAGGNLSTLSIKDGNGDKLASSSFGLGYYAGGLMEISGPAGSKFKGQVEALYSRNNFKNTVELLDIKQKTRLSQISVPIMIKYFIIPSLSFNVGGSVNFNVIGKADLDAGTNPDQTTVTKVNFKDDNSLQTVQVGALAGATYYIYKGFFVDARYNYYFGKMVDQKDLEVVALKNMSAIQLGIGYKF